MKKCLVCGKPATQKNLCSFHDKNHDPIPEHYVAKERTCLRCGEGFDSAFAGDRICPSCREVQRKAENGGHWHESPLEPLETPALV